MPHPDLSGRIARLDELTRGLRHEDLVIREGGDPLLYLERNAYLAALRKAVSGLESARVILGKAQHRMRR